MWYSLDLTEGEKISSKFLGSTYNFVRNLDVSAEIGIFSREFSYKFEICLYTTQIYEKTSVSWVPEVIRNYVQVLIVGFQNSLTKIGFNSYLIAKETFSNQKIYFS